MLTAVHCIMAILTMLHQPAHTSHAAPPRASRGATVNRGTDARQPPATSAPLANAGLTLRANPSPTAPAKLGVSPPNPSPNWDRLAQCESTGRWQANTGNGYYGGLQFSAHTWHANGGDGLPHEHTRDEQIAVATLLYQRRGRSPWPNCGRFL